jgi:hypothetical protein
MTRAVAVLRSLTRALGDLAGALALLLLGGWYRRGKRRDQKRQRGEAWHG